MGCCSGWVRGAARLSRILRVGVDVHVAVQTELVGSGVGAVGAAQHTPTLLLISGGAPITPRTETRCGGLEVLTAGGLIICNSQACEMLW